MILGHIKDWVQENTILHAAVGKGLNYLGQTDFSNIADGKHFIDGEKMYAVISSYLPEIKDKRRIESHQCYLDIQYIISGSETMGYANLAESHEIQEDCSYRDVIFYNRIANEIPLHLMQGMYAIFFPWDVHRPGCLGETQEQVRKVILKIKMSELGL